jgi:hypothetical protein
MYCHTVCMHIYVCKKYWLEHTWGVVFVVAHELEVFCQQYEKIAKIHAV